MSEAHHHLRSKRGPPPWLRAFVLGACLILLACLPPSCKQTQADEVSKSVSKDLIWSFMVNDSTPSARIRKWNNKAVLRGLMIIDQDRAGFYRQFSPLLRQVGESIGIKIDVCESVLRPGGVLLPLEPGCKGTSFDFHFVITNGTWTDSEWQGAQLALPGQARELLTEVRDLLATESKGKTCRYVIRQSKQVAGQIELGVAVIDSKWDPLESTCRHASLSIL